MKIYFTEAEDEVRRFYSTKLEEHGLKVRFASKLEHVPEDTEILSIFIYSKIDREFLDSHPSLKLIASRSVTLNHVDMGRCKSSGVKVTNVPDYGENAVAEHTFALILTLSRKIKQAAEANRVRKFTHSELRGFDLMGKTLGILGTGRSGTHAIRIAKGFQMDVIAHDIHKDSEISQQIGFEYVPLEELWKCSDIISLHVPLTRKTHHILNRDSFELCKKGVLIINTADGNLIDTEAMLEFLDNGHIIGAGLDVLEEESVMQRQSSNIIGEQIVRNLKADVAPRELRRISEKRMKELQSLMMNKALLNRDNVVITPHIAYNSQEAVEQINRTTMESILQACGIEPPSA